MATKYAKELAQHGNWSATWVLTSWQTGATKSWYQAHLNSSNQLVPSECCGSQIYTMPDFYSYSPTVELLFPQTLCKFNFLNKPFFLSPSRYPCSSLPAWSAASSPPASTECSLFSVSFSTSFGPLSSFVASSPLFPRLIAESYLAFLFCECFRPCRKERREDTLVKFSGASIVAFGDVSASG